MEVIWVWVSVYIYIYFFQEQLTFLKNILHHPRQAFVLINVFKLRHFRDL